MRNAVEPAVVDPSWPPPEGMALVVLVDNGPFTAAGVIMDKEEFKAATNPEDPRVRFYFHIRIDSLSDVLGDYAMECLRCDHSRVREGFDEVCHACELEREVANG